MLIFSTGRGLLNAPALVMADGTAVKNRLLRRCITDRCWYCARFYRRHFFITKTEQLIYILP